MLPSRANTVHPATRYSGAALPMPWPDLLRGIVISLLLHSMFIYAYRAGWSVRTAPYAMPPPLMTVRLHEEPPPALPDMPPPPVVLAEPVLPALPAWRPAPAEVLREHNLDRKAAPTMTWLPPAAAGPDSAQAPAAAAETAADPADPFSTATPSGRFDVDAARRAARQFAHEPDPAKAGTALAQLPPKPLATETPLARSIREAGRRDCRDGIPGGLLAPLLLALDKKDHGCKW